MHWVMLALMIGGCFWWAGVIRRVVSWGRTIAPPPRRRDEAVSDADWLS